MSTAAYKSTYFAKTFAFKYAATGLPININGWTFQAKIKNNRTDTTALLTLTTANGGFAVTDAANGLVEMRITSVQTDTLPKARLVFDVLRTDASPGPLWLFEGSFRARQPVTY